jgi:hypothetical protein
MAACGRDTEVVLPDPPYVPPPETCTPNDLDRATTFLPCSTGSGIFGQWVVDDDGLPAYEYGLDQNADDRARFFNTEKLDRRDHLSSFGNGRITALASNDGYLEVTTQDRGLEYLNKFDASLGHFAGGFSFIDDGSAWSTAYKWRPPGAKVTRRFGIGYAQSTMRYHGLAITRTQFAPDGALPLVADEVLLVNETSEKKSFSHYEYWDVARRPIETNWIVSGEPLTAVPQSARDKRDARNAMFQEVPSWDSATWFLGLRRTYVGSEPAPPVDAPSSIDYWPNDPFLAVLIGATDDVFTDRARFFGKGGIAAPDGVSKKIAGDFAKRGPISGAGQDNVFVIKTNIVLPPNSQQLLRFGFGYARHGEPFQVEAEWHDPKCDMRKEARAKRLPHLAYFVNDRTPWLQREMAWHTARLEDSAVHRDYWGKTVVPQGSAYLYLHGADGALRDLGLFALPLVYTHASFAREELDAMMGMQRASDRAFSYAFQGHGVLDDALGIHAKPSDQDLFFLLALGEYVGATGDTAYLDAFNPYWPKEAKPQATTLDHVKDALRHFFDDVGTGPHGLVRIGDGDWSDGIVFEAKNRDLAIASGESIPNTQMAVAVLPRIADLIEDREPALATEVRAKVSGLRAALAPTWTGSFYGRAYFGDGELLRADKIDLEAQVWALVGDTFTDPSQRAALVSAIASKLDEPSPIGATLVPGGQVWPAISGLLTWGYAASDPERAWTHLTRNTLTAHALAWPSIWYGIWSGPDGISTTGDHAGEAWWSPVTPMVDFPVLNNNAHAMPLLALLRTVGVVATAEGLELTPHLLGHDVTLQTELFTWKQRGRTLSFDYTVPFAVERTVDVVAPRQSSIARASLDGTDLGVPPGATRFPVTVPPHGGQAAKLVVVFQ